jgi:hypothetical protein
MVTKILDFLYEYANIFPCSFTKMKGMIGKIDEMKIELNPST